ncbi:hypothetical protein HZH68_016220 [Vespula germanica]|uniref:Uncharacterized protein n=1 Tax=Vespula germanica TaxID=30212 RepID=A0A834MPH7_VESGE|nr:hypothetical protein HZH68_016220 [Vespula germanica]
MGSAFTTERLYITNPEPFSDPLKESDGIYLFQRIHRWGVLGRGYNRFEVNRALKGCPTLQVEHESKWNSDGTEESLSSNIIKPTRTI